MKAKFLSLLTIFVCTLTNAQAPDFAWVKQTIGSNNETPVGVSLDASGNIYTSGYFEGTVDFDPGVGTYTMMSPGIVSMYITKNDPLGNFIWARQVSTPVQLLGAVVHPNGQALCANGDLCITGYYNSAFDFDPGAGNYYMAVAGINAFVLKLDNQGNFLWARNWGANLDDIAIGIAVDAADAVYTTGFFMDTVDFDPGVSTFSLATTATNSPEAFVSKLDAAGNFVWVKKLDSNAGSVGNAIALDGTGNIYSTGTFFGISDFDPGIGTLALTSAGDQDIFVWKLNASGNVVWAKSMGGTNKEAGTAILPDASGNVFVSGFFRGTCDFDPSAVIQNRTSSGGDDLFTLKLDVQGNLLWLHTMGGSSTDVVSEMALDANGAVYSTGMFSGTVDFDAGPGTYTVSATAINPFILKYDAQGNFKWVKHLSSNAYAGGSGIAVNGSGDVFTVGIFSVTTDFDPNNTTYTLSGSGLTDAYLHKMTCGTTPTINAISSASLICKGETVTLTPSGASTYSWNAVAGTVLIINPATTTNYTLTGKDQNGCMSEMVISQNVAECTGIETFSTIRTVNVFPNPNKGEFEIVAAPFTQIVLFNNLGEIIFKKEIQTETTKISIEELSAGLYFLETTNSEKRQILKIVVEQ